ncbi:MAG TPA: PadR family transcriptional regulator, partial [Actinobacteria bacterium]|nr:PadR family transcriptional regulator [Actinomycetota bacterium]
TLYGALDRLVERGEIEVDREEQVSGRRRRYYRLRPSGEDAVAAEVSRMRSAIAATGTRFVATKPAVSP